MPAAPTVPLFICLLFVCLTTLLASVVRSVKVQTYTKVDDGHPLALFHKKFLGKSMEDEVAEWQKAKTHQIGGQQDQDEYEAMEEDQDQGKGKCKALDEGDDEVMNESEGKPDEDDGEATDEDDDDILPGCYVLDISIDGMVPKRLWVRADYIRIFNYFQTYYDKYAKPMVQAPSAVLTGQPGIGKSFWIYYAARRLLAETRPFIWFYEGHCYLFVDDGVYELPPNWRHNDFSFIIWTLVDSDQSSAGVPEILIPHGTRLFVMYVTPPATVRWSRMHKTTQSIVVVMNPWGRREIHRAARLSPLEGITKTHVNEIFDELGPIPRLCVNRAFIQLAQYRDQLHQTISNITMDDIRKLTNEASGLAMDAVSHKICLLRRQDRDDVHSRVAVTPITDSIKSRLLIQFQILQQAEQLRLYQFFEKALKSRTTAGIFYKAIAQSRLQHGMHLELVGEAGEEEGVEDAAAVVLQPHSHA